MLILTDLMLPQIRKLFCFLLPEGSVQRKVGWMGSSGGGHSSDCGNVCSNLAEDAKATQDKVAKQMFAALKCVFIHLSHNLRHLRSR